MKIKYLSGMLLLGASLTMLSGCHDDLNIQQPSQFTSNSMWIEESDATSAVNGAFTLLRTSMSEFLNVWGEMRSNLYCSGSVNDAFYNRIGTNVLMTNDSGTNWANVYKTINAANLILKHAPSISFSREDTKNEVLANAYFVRAFCYYELVRVFGDCPLLTSGFESETQSDMYPTRTAASEVYAQVESDIEQALKLMPTSVKSLHKASPAAINMLRADYYLWKAARLSGGTDALQKAQTSVNAVLSAGYSLQANFADVFDLSNENNSELILTFPYTVGENVEAGKSPNFFAYFLAPSSTTSQLANAGYTQDQVPTGSHAQYVTVTADYGKFLLADPSDVRGAASVKVYDDEFLNNEVLITSIIVKFKGSWTNSTRVFENDVPVYRLAEAYMLKAEVENALGNTASAISALNVIAKRARGVDNYYSNLSKEQITQAIIDESKMEFVSEGKQWWLYLRLNKEFEQIATLVGRQSETNVTLWPVAQACITSNSNITQTPGYN